MINLYDVVETDFTHNGIAVLDKKIVNPEVREELNGIYKFTFKYPVFSKYSDLLENQNIVRCHAPDGYQLFRIRISKKQDGYLLVTAYHIFYDLRDNIIKDINIVGGNGTFALAKIMQGTQYPHGFNWISDIGRVSNCRIVEYNPVEALLDSGKDNTFINRWGGELKRDNFTVKMLNSIGQDRGVQIRYRKNLVGYEANLDYSKVVTRIMPKGFDGLSLPEIYVDSPNINAYHQPKIQKIEYKEVKAIDPSKTQQDEEALPLSEALAMLRDLAGKEFSENHIDLPHADYKVEFQELASTEEYKDLKVLESVYLGDTVTVIHEEENLNIKAKVIAYTYNPLKREYTSVELGNYRKSFTDIVGKVERLNEKVEETEKSVLQQAKDNATELINSGFGGHVRIHSDRVLIMDTEDEMTAVKVWQWNQNGFGYSSTGINGPYGLAMTMDGAIVADFITAGKLSGNLIQGGLIQGQYLQIDSSANFADGYNPAEKASKLDLEATAEGLSIVVSDVSDIQGQVNSQKIYRSSTPPTTPFLDMYWLDTSTAPESLKRWDGTTWKKITPTEAGEVGSYTKAEVNSAISQKANEINLLVEQSIDNIVVGGRNLRLKSRDFIFGDNNSTTNPTTRYTYDTYYRHQLNAGGTNISLYNFTDIPTEISDASLLKDETIVSIWLKRQSAGAVATVYARWRDTVSSTDQMSATVNPVIGTDWTRVSIQLPKPTISANKILLTITLPAGYTHVDIKREMMIETGNKPSAYTPAIEDVESRLSSAEISIRPSQIVSIVRESTYYINDLGRKVGIDEIISMINQTAETVKIQASKIELEGYVTATELGTSGGVGINAANIDGELGSNTIKTPVQNTNNIYMQNQNISFNQAGTRKLYMGFDSSFYNGGNANGNPFVAFGAGNGYGQDMAIFEKKAGEMDMYYVSPGYSRYTAITMSNSLTLQSANKIMNLADEDLYYFGTNKLRLSRITTSGTINPESASLTFSNAAGIYFNQYGTFTVCKQGAILFQVAPDGSKTGGVIELDGKNLGMSPTDSPQTLIEYIEFGVPLSEIGTKVFIESTWLKSVGGKYGVFVTDGNAKVIERGIDYVVIAGSGITDIRFVGERTGHEGRFYKDMDAELISNV